MTKDPNISDHEHPPLPLGLLPILDLDRVPSPELPFVIEEFIENDHQLLLVRSKKLNDEKYLEIISEISQLTAVMNFSFLAYHHDQILRQPGCVGIHLTTSPIKVGELRQKIPAEQGMIGYSAHSVDEALQAIRFGCDYIILGAIFPTPKEHAQHPVLGLEPLKELSRRSVVPVYAVGGINEKNLTEVASAGAAGFVALRAVYDEGDLEHQIAKLQMVWEQVA